MGQYIPDRDYVAENPTEQALRSLWEEYLKNIHTFEIKEFDAAGARARKNLLQMRRLIIQRRAEIQENAKTKNLL